MNPKSVRTAAGWSLAKTAGAARCSIEVVRLYEANRDAVSETKRTGLDALYAELARLQ